MGSNHHELSCRCLKIEHTRKNKQFSGIMGYPIFRQSQKWINYRETTYGDMYDLTDGWLIIGEYQWDGSCDDMEYNSHWNNWALWIPAIPSFWNYVVEYLPSTFLLGYRSMVPFIQMKKNHPTNRKVIWMMARTASGNHHQNTSKYPIITVSIRLVNHDAFSQ